MAVLVTGGAGFVGSHLADRLVAHGKHVVVCDDLSAGRLAHLTGSLTSGALTFVYLDVAAPLDTVREALRAATRERFSEVFHFAAVRGADGAVPWEPVLAFAREENARVLLASDGDARLSAAIRADGVNGAVVRIFGGYGPRMDFTDGSLVSELISAAREKRFFPLDGLAPAARLTFVGDIIDGIILVAASGERSGRLIDLGDGDEVSTAAVARCIAEIAGRKTARNSLAAIGEDVRGRGSDPASARELGWRPRTGLYEGLRRTYAWARREALLYA